MANRQVLRLVMSGSLGATHGRFFEGFKLRRMSGLGGMVSRGLSDDHACVLMGTRRMVGLYDVVVVSAASLTRSLL
jgi:hypothetical protein